jgi:hypothetical protein
MIDLNSKPLSLVLVGAGVGFLFGSSMGIAGGGIAFNAALLFSPLGGLLGWLVAQSLNNRNEKIEDQTDNAGLTDDTKSDNLEKNQLGILGNIVWSGLALMAVLWNFHLYILRSLGVLNAFIKNPWMFFALCILVSLFIPIFGVIYFIAWLAANSFGASEDTEYEAEIK